MIPVSRPYLPSREALGKYIDGIYERHWLTNNGMLVQELTRRLEDYLGVENLLLVSNGTLALQVAYRALGLVDEFASDRRKVITTPFTFVATASSLKWEGLQPVFADIDPQGWCINPAAIAAKVSADTRAIVPVHVFGGACDVEVIDTIARKHQLKVIYDAAHAFGVQYKGESLLKWGDAATLSFHATKLFHTGEGGAIVFRRKEDWRRAERMINFGITGPESIEGLGINAKMNELQAAMGLCVLDEIEQIMEARRSVWEGYARHLGSAFPVQARRPDATNNHAYFPILLSSEDHVRKVMQALAERGVMSRRYFYPSLDRVPEYSVAGDAVVSGDIASRILCLPVYAGLSSKDVDNISTIVLRVSDE